MKEKKEAFKRVKNIANKSIFWAFLMLTAFGFTAAADVSAQNDVRTVVSGQGSLPAVTESGDTRKRIFAVSARRGADGSVSGNAILHNPAFTVENGQKYRLQVDISCMNVIGNIVFLGGTTRRTNDPNLVDAVYFSVQDNGEPGRGSDMISRVFFFDDDPTTTGDPQLCLNNRVGDFPMEIIESGNINVRSNAP